LEYLGLSKLVGDEPKDTANRGPLYSQTQIEQNNIGSIIGSDPACRYEMTTSKIVLWWWENSQSCG